MKNFKLREIGKDELFDPLIICPDTPFTQAQFYGEWQTSLGKEVKRFVVSSDQEVVAYFQLIRYPLLRDKSYFYIPYGPVIKEPSDQFLDFLKTELSNFAKKNNAVFIRLDFTPTVKNLDDKKLLGKIFRKAPMYTYHSAYFQPRAEWFLDLNKTEDDILKEMHEKTRYSVRLAGRKGITTEIVSSDFVRYFSVFYELMFGTAKRNGFSLHIKSYYENIFQNLQPNNAYLSVARYKEEILAIDLIICYGQVANYVFGGSSDEHRNLMPTYLAQWAAICHAKKTGNLFYNFGGIASGKIYKGWDGLTIFKKKFGGREVVHSEFFDVVAQPFWYSLYNIRKLIKKYI